MNDHKYNILVADDIESIRTAIRDYLANDYNIFEADSGVSALEIFKTEKIDLLLTDIRMPVMGGIELIKNIHQVYPDIPCALMTAYNVNDFIEYARNERIWNIIPKSTFLDLHFIKTMIYKLLSDDIFGIEKYFPETVKREIKVSALHNLAELQENIFYSIDLDGEQTADENCELIGEMLVKNGCPTIIRQVIDELTSNAMIHGNAYDNKNRKNKYHDPFNFSFGKLKGKFAIAVMDKKGTLDREEILLRLERHVKIDPATGLPLGITDSHGRGLFISRENLDHLIFNIEINKRTEALGIISPHQAIQNRSLSVYQIPSAAVS